MQDEDLAAGLPSNEERYEWESFLGLLHALDVSAVNPGFYNRCRAAARELRDGSTICRRGLLRATGLNLQESTLEFELVLGLMVRDRILEPIPSKPFCFRVGARNSNNAESSSAAHERSTGAEEPVTIRHRSEWRECGPFQQLELALGDNEKSISEGEERCNR
jgi:hypothetical protein